MGCSCQPQVNHSQLSSKLTENLKIITYVFVGFCIFKILFISSTTILNDILLIVILYALYTQLSYLMGFFAIFFIMFDFIFELMDMLQILQNYYFGFNSNKGLFYAFVLFIELVIYFFLLKYSFLCSREYKALFFEQKSGGVFQEYQMFTEDFNNNNYIKINDSEPKGYKPFSGQGFTWGDS